MLHGPWLKHCFSNKDSVQDIIKQFVFTTLFIFQIKTGGSALDAVFASQLESGFCQRLMELASG